MPKPSKFEDAISAMTDAFPAASITVCRKRKHAIVATPDMTFSIWRDGRITGSPHFTLPVGIKFRADGTFTETRKTA